MRPSGNKDYRVDPEMDQSEGGLKGFVYALKSLWPFLWQYRYRVGIAFSLLIIAKVATVTMPWALKVIVDSLDQGQVEQLIVPMSMLLLYGFLRFGTVFFSELRDAVFSRVTERTMRMVGLKVFKHLHQLELDFHLSRQTGGISRDIDRGTNGISFMMRMMVFNIVPTLFELSLVAGILFINFSPWYSILTVGAVLTYIAFTVFTTEWRTKFVREANMLDSKSNTRAIDSLLNYETVKYFNNEHYEAKQYDENLEKWESARMKNRLSLAALNSGQALIISLAVMLMMILAAKEVVAGTMTLGDLVMINAYMIQLFIPLNFLGFVYREIRRALTDVENMFHLLDRDSKIQDSPNAQDLAIANARIDFKNLNFGYHPDRPILKDINFNINPGEKIALVGGSGAGKSTIARLLFRFYDLNSGQIKIDDQDISQVTQESLRAHIGVVPQDTVLFNDTIFNNVAYGNPKASENEVRKSIQMAHLDGFIESLPQGEETLVGERGLKVSGGEKQRIAIARTLLKNPSILIFDEATSALDSASEQAILKAMEVASEGRTTLVIAHRLSTIVDSDRIIVLEQGRVIEQGTHIELIEQKGRYAQLWSLQQSNSHQIN